MPSGHARRDSNRGQSIVELLVATSIALSIAGVMLTIVMQLHARFRTELERVDSQQRVRVGINALVRDLSMAGAGSAHGVRARPMGVSGAAVLPYRQGMLRGDPPGTVRADVATLVYVPAHTSAQTTLNLPMPARSGTAFLDLDPGCPLNDPACGFSSGMDLLIGDDTGAYDTFRVLGVQGNSLQLQHTMLDSTQTYAAGSRIVEVESHTYYVSTDATTGTSQLMHYDGVSSDAAVVDHVVGLAFEYFGDASPAVLITPVTDPAGPWTTYGPAPPPLGVQTSDYPAGENCLFQRDGNGEAVPRLPALGLGPGLVALTPAQLGDGPWCPDPVNAHRYDADLLRVRRIRVTLRIEAAMSAFRGPAGLLFVHAGTSRDPGRWVADHEIQFDVAPRNLNVGR